MRLKTRITLFTMQYDGLAVKKNISSALRASIWSKNRGGGGNPPGPSPGSATAIELRTESAIVMSNVTIKVVTSSFEVTRHGSD